MKIQLYGGPRDGQDYDLGDSPFPEEITVALCLPSDYIGHDIDTHVDTSNIGQSTVYRNAGCGRHYVHDGMRGHQA